MILEGGLHYVIIENLVKRRCSVLHPGLRASGFGQMIVDTSVISEQEQSDARRDGSSGGLYREGRSCGWLSPTSVVNEARKG